jgi:hypothetical protein
MHQRVHWPTRCGGCAFAVAILLCAICASPVAAATGGEVLSALDGNAASVPQVDIIGDGAGVAVGTAQIDGFPTKGGSYAVVSSGDASALPGDPSTFTSVNLPNAAAGADGNDLTQVRLHTKPPAGSTCVAFDFAFLSEEYPEYVGSSFNDIFTAELNDSLFSVSNGQVVAPNNFAYDAQGNPVSINTVIGLSSIPGTTMDGATPALTATSPVEKRVDGTMDIIFSVQDLGDSIYDSAVMLDNLRFGSGANCVGGTTDLTDTDGDGLTDKWETQGIDVDRDGTVDLDLPAMGATPDHKDMFIEVDHMVKPQTCVWLFCWGGNDFSPQQSALDDVRASFAASPLAVRMHIDAGPSSVMDPTNGSTWGARSRAGTVPYTQSLGTMSGSDYQWSAFDAIKTSNFDLARREAFHYVVYADTYAGSGSSGISRGIPGSDLLVTDGDPSWNGGFTRTQERGTFMHELGHGLSLLHGGDINDAYRPGYMSIMSYSYQLTGLPPHAGLDYSHGSPFDDWAHIRFDGGAIGAHGSTTTPPDSTPADEQTAADFKSNHVFGAPGDGGLTFVGPTVLIPKSGTAMLLFDVTNVGEVATSYTVAATSAVGAIAGSATANVPAGQTVRMRIPVDTTSLAPGTVAVTARLSSVAGGAGLSQTTADVKIPDMNDPAVRAAAMAARDQLNGLPAGSGVDPEVRAQVVAAITKVMSWTATLTVKGTTNATYASALATVSFTPSSAAPRQIELREANGERRLSLSVQRLGLPLAGSLVFSPTATAPPLSSVVASTWNASKLTLSGTWIAAPVKVGTFTLTLKPPG